MSNRINKRRVERTRFQKQVVYGSPLDGIRHELIRSMRTTQTHKIRSDRSLQRKIQKEKYTYTIPFFGNKKIKYNTEEIPPERLITFEPDKNDRL